MKKNSPWFRNMSQQETGEVMESEDGSVEFDTPTDDEEITIPWQDKYRNVPDIPDSDIRDEQTLSNTQREDWLLPTEPMHGARPRQTGRDRPPVTQGCCGKYCCPESESDFPVVARTADFDGRGGIHTAEGGGGWASGP